jgi:hypothetical protein
VSASSTSLWNVRQFDQTLGTYSNLDAARAHGEHVIRFNFRYDMDRRKVPEASRAIDWRVDCCGHLFGPGQFNHTAYPERHVEGCLRQQSGLLTLRPFWAVSGQRAGGGHVNTDWEIWQGVAYDRFDPSTVLV